MPGVIFAANRLKVQKQSLVPPLFALGHSLVDPRSSFRLLQTSILPKKTMNPMFSDLIVHEEHWKRSPHDKFDRILAGFYSLAGGVIFGTVFIDVIPHVQFLLSNYEKQFSVRTQFPLCYFLIMVGFLLTYFLEEGTAAVWRYHRKMAEEDNEPYSKRPGHRRDRRREVNIMVAAVTFAAAMSIHSFLEGFTLFQNTTNRIVELLLALVLHKVVESLSSEESKQAHREKVVAIITAILVFGLMIPLGSAIGSLIDSYELSDHTQNALILVFESLAGGIFIYVAMFEIIIKQRYDSDRILHLWVIFIGFMIISALHFVFGSRIVSIAE